jgi:rubredoxin
MRHEQIEWLCSRCGSGCDPSGGCDEGAALHASWEAIPPDWHCPGCGAPKSCLESHELVYQCAFFALARL